MLEILEMILAAILLGGFFGFLILSIGGVIVTFALAVFGAFIRYEGIDHDVWHQRIIATHVLAVFGAFKRYEEIEH